MNVSSHFVPDLELAPADGPATEEMVILSEDGETLGVSDTKPDLDEVEPNAEDLFEAPGHDLSELPDEDEEKS